MSRPGWRGDLDHGVYRSSSVTLYQGVLFFTRPGITREISTNKHSNIDAKWLFVSCWSPFGRAVSQDLKVSKVFLRSEVVHVQTTALAGPICGLATLGSR